MNKADVDFYNFGTPTNKQINRDGSLKYDQRDWSPLDKHVGGYRTNSFGEKEFIPPVSKTW